MRVLYILQSTNVIAGATKAFMNMLRGLMKKGVEPEVLLPGSDGIYDILVKEKIVTHVLNYRSHVYPSVNSLKDFFLFFPRLFMRCVLERRAVSKLKDIVKKRNIDIIHTNVSVVKIGYKVALDLNVKHLYHVREYGDLDFGLKYIPIRQALINQLGDGKTYSVFITKDVQRHYGQQRNPRSCVIYDGAIKYRTYEELPSIKTEERFFLFAGRIEPAKGAYELIDAYVKYSENTKGTILPLFIAGEWHNKSYYNKIMERIPDGEIRNRIHFLGRVSNINELMAKTWAIVIPSINEGFGLCTAEAMSNLCLVIGRNTGGTKEQFDSGLALQGREIGIRFQNDSELPKLLEYVAEMGEEERNAYVLPAFHVVNQLYTAESHANSIFELYNQMMRE